MKEGTPKRKTTTSVEQSALSVLGGLIRESGPSLMEGSRRILEGLAIDVRYTRNTDPEYAHMREALQKERGLLIANHPGAGDVFALAQMIERRDARILVTERIYPFLASLEAELGVQYFIKASSDPKEAAHAFGQMREQILSGGLVMLFPGGGERKGQGTQFADAFRLLVGKVLQPEDMVYACKITGDTKASSLDELSRISGAGIAQLTKGALTTHRYMAPRTLSVDERLTRAGEWQEALVGVGRKEGNTALTYHFEELFARGPEPLDETPQQEYAA